MAQGGPPLTSWVQHVCLIGVYVAYMETSTWHCGLEAPNTIYDFIVLTKKKLDLQLCSQMLLQMFHFWE